MTNLQALQAGIEYSGTDNANIFTKVLLDRGISGGTEYTASNEKSVDLALADLCLYLSTHPKIGEGDWNVDWSSADLLSLRNKLYSKWGLVTPENQNQNLNLPKITGKPVTIATEKYPVW